MIVYYANDPEMIAYAKSLGAKGITVSGVCCTSNEVTMRHGVPMAGNFLSQENVVLTGACEAILLYDRAGPVARPQDRCSHPDNRTCRGVWADRQRLRAMCLGQATP